MKLVSLNEVLTDCMSQRSATNIAELASLNDYPLAVSPTDQFK